MSAVDPTDALVKMAEALGLTAADLAAVGEQLTACASAPTVAELEPQVRGACSAKSLPTYGRHFTRLAEAFGDRPVTAVTANDLCALRDETMAAAAREKIERAERKGRPLRSYELDAHGRGAGENAVRAYRFFFKYARKEELVRDNVAMDVEVPKRLPAPERPLVPWELEEVATVWCTTGNDPELDTMMFEFHRKTAARREGGLNLRLAVELTRFGGHLTSWEDVHDAEGKAAVSA